MNGPLHGRRVIEIAHHYTAFTGKLLGDLGADVIVVEPPGGAAGRRFGPFAGDVADPDRCVWWWANNTSKRSVTLDSRVTEGRLLLEGLIRSSDVVLDGLGDGPHGLGIMLLDRHTLSAAAPALVWASITPYGARSERNREPVTDLTLAAGGGLAWSCGYDDHSLPPVRPAGDQTILTGGIWAAMGVLAALVHVDASGVGQHVDVSIHAAVNVTTEQATYEWLVARRTVERLTGRHASVTPTPSRYIRGRDGGYVNMGVPLRTPREYRAVVDWLHETSLSEGFPDLESLERGATTGVDYESLGIDATSDAVYAAGRAALQLLADHLSAYEFFVGAQRRGVSAGIVYAPEEVVDDPHFVARGFATPVFQPQLGRSATHGGAPFKAAASPWAIKGPAPSVGQHDAEVLRDLRGEPAREGLA